METMNEINNYDWLIINEILTLLENKTIISDASKTNELCQAKLNVLEI